MDKLTGLVENFAVITDSCKSGGGFFGFPTWYKYLPCGGVDANDNQIPANELSSFELNYIWLILLAVLDMLILLAGMLAVGYFIYSGFLFMTSQGNPERVGAARKGMINAAVGLIIVLMSAGIVQLVVGAF